MERLPFKPKAILLAGLVPIFIALFIYSVTWAFIWDEGFHLIAAQLIAGGKRPYLDFCFPQTPLNAYLNAGILLIFGHNWRFIHLAAAAYMCAAIWMVADFVQSRLPSERWRTPCALAAGVLFGLNSVVLQFGPAAQAYAIGMLLNTAAFRAAIVAIRVRSPWFALLTGLCAGAAAASTLLTAPVAMVLLLWLLLANLAGSRSAKVALYLFGCTVPFSPVIWFYFKAPRQTLFNVLRYQALFRRVNWGDANMHDLDALTDWLNSPQGLLLISLFAAAILFLARQDRSAWLMPWKEYVLAVALTVALVLFISTAHPTFERYYVVAMPFVTILAALGLHAVGVRLAGIDRPWLTCGLVIALGYAMFGRDLFDEREDNHWSGYEDVAKAVTEVAPLGTSLYADELIYFLLERDPPSGLEFSYAERLELPPAEEKLFHIISLKELRQQIQSGHFTTLETCREQSMDDLQPTGYFKQHTEPNDCDLFWQPKVTAAAVQREVFVVPGRSQHPAANNSKNQ